MQVHAKHCKKTNSQKGKKPRQARACNVLVEQWFPTAKHCSLQEFSSSTSRGRPAWQEAQEDLGRGVKLVGTGCLGMPEALH